MTKGMRFAELPTGAPFVYQVGGPEQTKLGPRRAQQHGAPGPYRVKPNTYILAVLPDPTPEQVQAKRATNMTRHLEGTRAYAQGLVEAWGTKFANAPAYAFEWADQAMEAAARVAVYTEAQRILAASGLDKLMVVARGPTRRAANTMAQYMNQAWAEIAAQEEEL